MEHMVVGTVIDYEENNNSNNYYFESVIHTGFPKRGVVSSVICAVPPSPSDLIFLRQRVWQISRSSASHHSLSPFFVGGVVWLGMKTHLYVPLRDWSVVIKCVLQSIKYGSIRIIIVNSYTLHFTGTTGTCRGGWGTTHPLPGVRDGRYFHYHDSCDYN